MKITASQVNELRKKTGAGMMDCKKALVESEGDFEKAIEILRKKGQKVAAKRGNNEVNEGLVIAVSNENRTRGVIVQVNCETDFVAKNSDFFKFVNNIAKIALNSKVTTIEELNALKTKQEITVADSIIEQIGKIGEKIEISKLKTISSNSVVAYNHPGNQIASIVGLNQNGDKMLSVGKNIAMQIAAMNPLGLDKDSISQDIIDKELEIAKDLIRQEGKPEEMVDKIALGKLNKFFKENTLLEQDFIKDNKISVSKYLKMIHPDLIILKFYRLSLS